MSLHKDDLIANLFFTIICLILTALSFSAIGKNIGKGIGQIDYANGKIYYIQTTNADNKVVWKWIDLEKKELDK